MKKYDEQLSEEALRLHGYLNQYRNCIRAKHALEYRRKDIIKEFGSPLSGVKYDGMPRGSSEGVGCAALSFRLDEIDSQIREQIKQAAETLCHIIDIVQLLPENSIERAIIEARYIDRLNWRQICHNCSFERAQANRYWKRGLYRLLEFERVKKLMEDYQKEQGK